MDDQGLAAGLGRMQWELALCLLLAWVACYFCIWKGVKYFGKVVYFTVAFPFFLLIILFIRGVTLPGAWTGIMYYMYPDLSRIGNGYVWYNAVTEVLYSYAICQGVLTALSSYNRYKYDCYK
ncbi:hypothetical protein SKAU_G00022270 [Synaphobranchus kaupii]|uniref:Uncharacterized protein n=1 Tax=Synaphobranchus kaupii TaxID=118154 RepID=A0A9Q1JER1_SYNKA|nr:hypothetical protein SKAU_G00022270 [Synaphobranchus kaupii]